MLVILSFFFLIQDVFIACMTSKYGLGLSFFINLPKMSSSNLLMVLGSENSPTRTPQPDPTDDEPIVQEYVNRAEYAENITNGVRDKNVRL